MSDIIKRHLLITYLLLKENHVSTKRLNKHLSQFEIDNKLLFLQRNLVLSDELLSIDRHKTTSYLAGVGND